jgi:hypothetical protein
MKDLANLEKAHSQALNAGKTGLSLEVALVCLVRPCFLFTRHRARTLTADEDFTDLAAPTGRTACPFTARYAGRKAVSQTRFVTNVTLAKSAHHDAASSSVWS